MSLGGTSMAEEDGWEILIRGTKGDYVRTQKIADRREAILTAYGMLNHSDVVEIQSYGPTGLKIIDLETIRREGAA